VTEQSTTRRQLEASIRALLPERGMLGGLDGSHRPTAAAAGLGGVATGYLWGRIKGRRTRKRRGR
jgi:hypothetical protein